MQRVSWRFPIALAMERTSDRWNTDTFLAFARHVCAVTQVLVPVLEVLTQVYNDLDDDQDMVTPAQIGLQLIDWTDPEKGM